MNAMTIFILGILNAMIVDNVILSRFFGICPFLGVSKDSNSAFKMGLAVTFIVLLSAIITYPLYHFVLVKANIFYMDTICYILIIASLVQFTEIILKKYSQTLYQNLGVYLPLIATNCCVLGVSQANTDNNLSFLDSIANALGTSLGFVLIIVTFSFIRKGLEESNVPKCLQGIPIALITAAIMGLAYMGLSGVINI